MNEAILSLGSNLGERINNLRSALRALDNLEKTSVLKVSNFYETEPFGTTEKQNKYINCCAMISTELSPKMLMGACLGIESALGRVRKHRFCARTIDIDILLYEDTIIHSEELVLPHPRMLERSFVLIPMNDICEGLKFKSWNFGAYLQKIKNIKLDIVQKK
ncbi:MAG: 2-amino-4-hydroxy-6-hydroxymethyldihydropteridine diphosphokinase [Acutalibacteraceae bacterium]